MLLAVDIGNTNTVAGVFDGERIAGEWRIATNAGRMADEYAALALPLLAAGGIDPGAISGAIVAGVVPAAQEAICVAIRRYFGVDPVIVGGGLDLGIRIHYEPPTGVGADRIANAVAAVQRYGAPAIVVDFGTGTNFDVIDADGVYVGGAIAPGLEIATDALFSRAAKLPPVPLEAPPCAVGANTTQALQSGIIYGYAGLVDGLVSRIAAELDGDPAVIATGGLAPVVAPHTRTVRYTDLDLTLTGLALIYARHVDTS